MKVPHTLLIACLGAAPLCAQQVDLQIKDFKVEVQKSAPPSGEAGATGSAPATGGGNEAAKTDSQTSAAHPGHHHGHGNAQPQPEQKSVAYIGVLTREVPAELRAQFSLADGFGLLVEEVIPDSPGKAAGLKVYDVLVKFEDQQLVNMEQFMALVRSKKKGDLAQLTVITGGKETKVPVTLGEHMVAAHADHHPQHQGFTGLGGQPHGMFPFNGEMFHGGQQHGFQNPSNVMREHMEHFQKEMREFQERMQEWAKGGHTGPMPQPPKFNQVPGGTPQQPEGEGSGHRHYRHPNQTGISIPPGTNLERFNIQTQTATNVSRSDDSGEYSIKSIDGRKTFTVRPKSGQEKSWPINNDAERQAVPQEFRDKLKMMDNTTSGVRIEINPGLILPGMPAPSPNGGDNAPALPPVKGKTTSA
jgi:hypothetical protein